MKVTLLQPNHPHWNAEIERVGLDLHAPDNSTLFPYHFLAVVLPRIGGYLVAVEEDGKRVGIGFLFPRSLMTDQGQPMTSRAHEIQKAYTLRYHPLARRIAPRRDPAPAAITAEIVNQLPEPATVVYYDPLAEAHLCADLRTGGDAQHRAAQRDRGPANSLCPTGNLG